MSVTELAVRKIKALPVARAKAVLAYLEKLEREQAKEDLSDARAARRALAEAEKKGFIAWERTKAELLSSRRNRKVIAKSSVR